MTQSEKNRIIQSSIFPTLQEARDRLNFYSTLYQQVKAFEGLCYNNAVKTEIYREELDRYARKEREAMRELIKAEAMMEYWQNLPVTK